MTDQPEPEVPAAALSDDEIELIRRHVADLANCTSSCSRRVEMRLLATIDQLRAEKQAATAVLSRATNTKYPNAPQELHALAKVAADMVKAMHDGLHDADDVVRQLRAKVAELEARLENVTNAPCDKSPIGMCVWKLVEGVGHPQAFVTCRYCGGPAERK